VYLDPPYVPLTRSADFTAYTRTGFDFEQQERLAKTFSELNQKGCFILESNSATEVIHQLYKKYRIIKVYAIRAISSNGSTRGKIPEYLISNYEPHAIQTKVSDF
jgi:DNA adenine methylase